jgi:hypothetical protein
MWLGEEDPHLLARAFVEAPDEMPAAQSWASRRGLELVYDGVALTSSLKLAGAGIDDDQPAEPYLLIASFDSYRLLPPIWQFRHPETGKDIGVAAYPKPVGESVLHPNGLICAHWSRLAYKEHGGPHPKLGRSECVAAACGGDGRAHDPGHARPSRARGQLEPRPDGAAAVVTPDLEPELDADAGELTSPSTDIRMVVSRFAAGSSLPKPQ